MRQSFTYTLVTPTSDLVVYGAFVAEDSLVNRLVVEASLFVDQDAQVTASAIATFAGLLVSYLIVLQFGMRSKPALRSN